MAWPTGRDDLPADYHHEERERRLDHMIQIATVKKIDAKKGVVQVAWNGDDKQLSGWLPVGMLRAGKNKHFHMYEEDEQVIIFAPSGELAQAVVWGAVSSDKNKELSDDAKDGVFQYEDGTRIEYDRKAHKFHGKFNDDAEVKTTVGKTTLTKTKKKITADIEGKSTLNMTKDTIKGNVGDKVSFEMLKDKITALAEGVTMKLFKDTANLKVGNSTLNVGKDNVSVDLYGHKIALSQNGIDITGSGGQKMNIGPGGLTLDGAAINIG